MPVKSIRPLLICLCLSVVLAAGCAVYRPEIQQGQTVKIEDVEKITQGMSPDEVREILGTPLVNDAFNQQRWDYVYNSIDRSRTPTELSVASIVFKFGVVDTIDFRTQTADIIDQSDEGVTVQPREKNGWFSSIKKRFSDFRKNRKQEKSEEAAEQEKSEEAAEQEISEEAG